MRQIKVEGNHITLDYLTPEKKYAEVKKTERNRVTHLIYVVFYLSFVNQCIIYETNAI
jgi:hypothetical protein